MGNPTPTLEQRIAAALTATDITSSDLRQLLVDVEAAAAAADADATKAREAALDPAVVIDTAKVGAAVATATLARDRVQAALPRLQQRPPMWTQPPKVQPKVQGKACLRTS